MLRTFILSAMFLLAPSAVVIAPSAWAAALDFSEVCYQAATEPPELKITDRILGYCTNAIDTTTEPAARANLLTNRAILHLKRNNSMQARADLTEALRIHPGAAAAHITTAHLHWLEGNLVAAEESLSAAIRSGDSQTAVIHRSIVRRTRGDVAGAMRDALTVAGYDTAAISRLAPEVSLSALATEVASPKSSPTETPAPAQAEDSDINEETIERD